MTKTEQKPLGAILKDSQIIRDTDIQRALAEQKESGIKFGEALIKLGIVRDDDVEWGLARQLGLPFVHLRQADVDPDAVTLVPEIVARRFQFVPYLIVEDRLTIVIDDPPDEERKREIEEQVGMPVSECLGLSTEICDTLDALYGTRGAHWPARRTDIRLDFLDEAQVDAVLEDPSGKTLLSAMLDHLAEGRFDSLHLEPDERTFAVRMKMRGASYLAGNLARPWGLALSAQIGGLVHSSGEDGGGFFAFAHSDQRRRYHVLIMEASQGMMLTVVPTAPPRLPATPDELIAQDGGLTALIDGAGGPGLFILAGPDAATNLGLLSMVYQHRSSENDRALSLGRLGWFKDEGALHLAVRDIGKGRVQDAVADARAQKVDTILIEELWGKELVTAALEAAASGTRVLATVGLRSAVETARYLAECAGGAALLSSGLRSIVAYRALATVPDGSPAVKLDPSLAARYRIDRYPDGATVVEHAPDEIVPSDRLVIESLAPSPELETLLARAAPAAEIEQALSASGWQSLREKTKQLVFHHAVAASDFAAALAR